MVLLCHCHLSQLCVVGKFFFHGWNLGGGPWNLLSWWRLERVLGPAQSLETPRIVLSSRHASNHLRHCLRTLCSELLDQSPVRTWVKASAKSRKVLSSASPSKVGEVPTLRASDTDTDLPIVSADLFHGFQYLKNCVIASKWAFISDTIASSHKKIHFMLKYRFKDSKSSVSTYTINCIG